MFPLKNLARKGLIKGPMPGDDIAQIVAGSNRA